MLSLPFCVKVIWSLWRRNIIATSVVGWRKANGTEHTSRTGCGNKTEQNRRYINVDNPKIGEIYWIKFDGEGSAQRGLRPGVIFSNNKGNNYGSTIIALPVTTKIKNRYLPTNVPIKARASGLSQDSVVICNSPETVPKDNIGSYISTLSADDMARITAGNMIATGAAMFLDVGFFESLRRQTAKLNSVC
nr:MAG TPA: PemK-like protein [Caudoviricetes sp.]